ncbi:MAG: hypothetical protein U0736_18345 [Gemmataceae bacterium]
MLISAVCPRCRTTYHVQDNLRGKAMRCQVTTCRHLFLIDDPPPAPPVAPPAPERPQQTGQVGDLVPLIPVEDVAPEPPTPVTGVGDLIELVPAEPAEPLPIPLDPVEPLPVVQAWEDGPPPARRRNGQSAKAKEPAPPAEDKPPKSSPRIKKPAAEPEPGPRVIEAGDWSAPPVRRGATDAGADDVPKPAREAVTVAPPVVEEPPAYDDTHRPPTHWAKWVVIPFVLLAFGGLGYGVFLVVQATRNTEERMAKEADTFFADRQFRSAAERYGQLLDRYPESEQTERYRFRRDLSELRNRMTEPPEEIGELLDHYEQFVKERQKDPLLPEDAADLGAALVKLLTDFADRAAATPTDDKPLETLKRAASVVAAAKAIRLPKGAAAPPWEQIDAAFGRVRAAIARMNERRELMAELERVAQKPSYASIVAFERLVRDREKAFPNLSGTPEVTKLLNGMYERHLQSVRYVEAAAPKKPVRRGEDEPALLLDPLIQGAALPGDRDNGVVLALVRGLLYGLERTSGKVRWAVRVGIDTTTLPVRVPARAGSEERILALSSDDPPTLTALDTSGHELWRHRLGRPVLGRPVVVDRRAWPPTRRGPRDRADRGPLLGRYLLGQPLTAGGTPEPGSRARLLPGRRRLRLRPRRRRPPVRPPSSTPVTRPDRCGASWRSSRRAVPTPPATWCSPRRTASTSAAARLGSPGAGRPAGGGAGGKPPVEPMAAGRPSPHITIRKRWYYCPTPGYSGCSASASRTTATSRYSRCSAAPGCRSTRCSATARRVVRCRAAGRRWWKCRGTTCGCWRADGCSGCAWGGARRSVRSWCRCGGRRRASARRCMRRSGCRCRTAGRNWSSSPGRRIARVTGSAVSTTSMAGCCGGGSWGWWSAASRCRCWSATARRAGCCRIRPGRCTRSIRRR